LGGLDIIITNRDEGTIIEEGNKHEHEDRETKESGQFIYSYEAGGLVGYGMHGEHGDEEEDEELEGGW